MTKASLLLHQHLFKFKVSRSLKKSLVLPNAIRRYGLVEVQGPWDMEDRCLVVPNLTKTSTLYGVFDGHNGNTASQYCVDHFGKVVANELVKSSKRNIEEVLFESFRIVDKEYCQQDEHISGSTACVLVVEENKITVANTGDSRAILVGKGDVGDIRAIPLSNDHKPDRLDERERIAKAGGTVSHWGVWRVEGILAMSRVIGDKSLKQFCIPDPDIVSRNIEKGDKFIVIGTDGVWDVLRNDEVALICSDLTNPEDAAMKIMQEIVDRGVVDNTTVIVVDVHV
jgi:protein phosphatase 1L